MDRAHPNPSESDPGTTAKQEYDFWRPECDRLETPEDEPPPADPILPDAGKRWDNRKLREYQRDKFAIADGLEAIGKPERARALRNCCTEYFVHRHEFGSVVRGTECRDLVCPTAQRSRARRLAASIADSIEDYLDRNRGQQGILVTFTIRSCSSMELRATVGKLIRAFGELMQRVAVKRAVTAWVRSLEVTHDPVTGLWHPHIHAVWFVERESYFRKNSNLYFSQDRLRQLWQKQLRLDYLPQVDVRKLEGVLSPLNSAGRKALREAIKYAVKPGTLTFREDGNVRLVGAGTLEPYDINDGQGVRPMSHVPLRALCDALRSRRLISTSRNLQADLDLDFTDDPDADREGPELGAYLCTEVYRWMRRGRDHDYHLVWRTFEQTG